MKSVKMFTLLVLLFILSTNAQQNGFGIGIIIGEPTGLSAKTFAGSTTAIDAAAAWSLREEAALHLHADYLFHSYNLFPVTVGNLPVYYGIGGRVKLADDPLVGVRIPVGIAYEFENDPFDIFFEIVPILDLAPETDFDLNGAIGARFYIR